MEDLFLRILNMSITGAWIVLAVCVLRLVLKKAPKWVSAALWGLVAIRLVCPFSLESIFSLLPSAETVPSDIAMSRNPTVATGVPALNSVINPVLQGSFTPEPSYSVNPLQVVNFIAAVVWIVGMVAMLLYAAISYIRLRKKTRESLLSHDNVYLCDRIDTPFILGLFKPRIYLPSDMDENDVEHVLAHEKAHLQRHDHWWKPFGFLLLTVHWFNPVLWLGYVLLCRDIELACDEKVIRDMDVQNKKAYSSALINCSVSRKSIAACPLAFGEVGVKNRIKTVLHYKKPTLWILIAAVLVSLLAAVCLLTNPVNKELGGYEYRVQRYYYDNVIGEDRANRELGEYTYEIDENLSTVRYINGNFHCHYTLVPVDNGTEKLIAAAESTLPAYYKLLNARQVYFREGWDSALREQSELNYFIIQYSDGSLIGGYIGAYDEVPGQIYKLQRTQKLPEPAKQDLAVEIWFDYVNSETMEWGSVLRYEHPSFPDTVFEWKEGQIYTVQNGEEALLISGMPVLNAVFCDLTGDGLPELCTTVAFGSGMVDHRIVVYDFAAQCEYTLHDRGYFDYWLTVEDGVLAANRSFYPKESAPATEKGRLLLQKTEDEYTLVFSFLKEAEKPLVQTGQLTLQDVVSLSQKGEELTWEDFGDQVYVWSGTGIYRHVYNIDDMFTLTVGGAVPEEKLMYAYLSANDGTQDVIDIRFDDVQSFIDAHKDNPIVADIEEMSTVHDASENEPAVPTDLLLYEDADWTFSSMASIGEEKTRMLELTDDYTQQLHPLVRIESEDELQNFAAYVGDATARVMENLNINADGNKRFDAAFFEENELLLLYLETDGSGEVFSYAGASLENGFLTLHINKTQSGTDAAEQGEYLLNGHLLTLAVPKTMLQSPTDVCCVVVEK